MIKLVAALRRMLAQLSPEQRWYLAGAGQVVDMFPEPLTRAFETSDAEALHGDLIAIGGDMWSAVHRARSKGNGTSGRI